jgi:phosphatidate cytidylyltransferase
VFAVAGIAFAASFVYVGSAQVFMLLIGCGCYLELASIVLSGRCDGVPFLFWSGQVLLVTFAVIAVVGRVLVWNDVAVFFAAQGVVFVEDVASLVVGRSFVTPRLPGVLGRVSPNKTVGGLIGGVIAGEMMGILFVFWMEAAGVLDVDFRVIAAMLLVPVVIPAGDLFESAMKRQVGIKDSGEILRVSGGGVLRRVEVFLESHGGFLDRFDGFLPVIVFLACLEGLL